MNSRLSILFSIATLFTKCNIIDSHEKQANQIKLTEIFSDSQTIDGHKKRIIFINTIDRGDYFYIPQAAFSDSIDAVLFQDKGLSRVHPNKRPVVFSWYSNCNDGNYNLTITPEQIFFSSGHDNPNPNYLYWIMDISKEQFEAINKGVRKSAPENFYDVTAPRNDSLFQDESEYSYIDTSFQDPCSIPKDWNDTTEHLFNICCDASIVTQLIRFLEILNAYIPIAVKKVILPNGQESLDKFPKLFSSSKQAIFYWAPSTF